MPIPHRIATTTTPFSAPIATKPTDRQNLHLSSRSRACPGQLGVCTTLRWSKPDSNPRSHSLRQPQNLDRHLLAAALVTKGRCSRSLGWSGTRGSTTVSPVVHVSGRSAGHAWPGSALDIVFGKWGGQRCRRIRLFLLQPWPGGGDLRRRLKPHRHSSTLRVSSSQRGSGIGRRRPTFRLFHRGRR